MHEHEFTEADWKLFRKRVANWQEKYMERLNKEYIEILSADTNAADKFWTLEKRINRDRKDAGVQLEMRRSRLLHNLIELIYEKAITCDDLEGFSEGLRARVRACTDRDFLDS